MTFSTQEGVRDGQTFCLFVCGGYAIDTDAWMFADFMAISKVFIATGGLKSTCINTFPYQSFIKQKMQSPASGGIGWNYKGPNNGTPLLEFRRDEEPWWLQIPEEDLPNTSERVLEEIRRIAKTAQVPDKVNIFFFCHSSDGNYLSIGGHKLTHAVVNKVIAEEFSHNVQVNLVLASCDSRLLEEKISNLNTTRRTVQTSASSLEKLHLSQIETTGQFRGSPFVAAYASSLVQGLEMAKTKMPGMTLQEHFDKVKTMGVSSNTDRSKTIYGRPRSWQGDGSEGVLNAVLNVLFRSYYVDSRLAGTRKTRQIFTPSKPGPQLPLQNSATASASSDVYIKSIKDELRRLRSPDDGSQNDKGFFTSIHLMGVIESPKRLAEEYGRFLSGMRWRLRVQEYFFVVFHDLLRDELIDETALLKPMDIEEPNGDVSNIVEILSCYEIGALCSHRAGAFGELTHHLGHGNFEMPIRWLAILIIRSHPETELSHILAYLNTTNKLGKLRLDFLKDCKPFEARQVPDANEAATDCGNKPYELGFILPTGIDLKDWAQGVRIRYEHYRGLYKTLYGEGAWGDCREFLKLLEVYAENDVEQIMGPRWRQREHYVDGFSPMSGMSRSVLSEEVTASTAITEILSAATEAFLSEFGRFMEEED
ncbi:hypothetical protein M3J09_008422 [Ascochyta lentis]